MCVFLRPVVHIPTASYYLLFGQLYLLKSTGMNEATPSDFLSLAGTDQAHSPGLLLVYVLQLMQ